MCGCDGPRVEHADTNRQITVLGCVQQAALDGERADAGEKIAAVLPIRNHVVVDADLEEQVIDVCVVVGGHRDHGDLRGQRVGAADAVDLAGVGRTHDPLKERVACGALGGQVVAQEVGALRGATSKNHASDALGHDQQSVKRRHRLA
jgi:hypothetical protein